MKQTTGWLDVLHITAICLKVEHLSQIRDIHQKYNHPDSFQKSGNLNCYFHQSGCILTKVKYKGQVAFEYLTKPTKGQVGILFTHQTIPIVQVCLFETALVGVAVFEPARLLIHTSYT